MTAVSEGLSRSLRAGSIMRRLIRDYLLDHGVKFTPVAAKRIRLEK